MLLKKCKDVYLCMYNPGFIMLSHASCTFSLCVHSEFVLSPTTAILFPGDTSAVFACQLSDGGSPLWEVNGTRYTLEELSDGNLNGHSANGTNITVSVPVNGTKYVCIILTTPPNSVILSDPAFLYIAGELHV